MPVISPFSVAVLLFIQIMTLQISAQTETGQYRQGRLVYKAQTWDIGLVIESDTGAKFYSEALLRSGVDAEEFSKNGNEFTFKIPFGIGQFTGQLRDGNLVGTVKLADGEEAPLELSPAALTKVRKEDFSFQNGDIRIAATLALPEKAGKYPVAIILHGGGDSSRDSPPYAFFADYLPKHGFACLIYDKRGNGTSDGNWRTVGFDERASDLVVALDNLKKHKEIDAGKMGLIGVSQGSWVAGIVADRSPDVAFVVHVVGPVVTPFEADTYAQKYRYRKAGWAPQEIREYLYLWTLETGYIREPQTDAEWSKLQDAMAEVSERDWFKRRPYRVDRDGWFAVWYKMMMDHDPLPLLQRSKIPMLWIYGNRDSQSDFAKNMALLSELKRAGKPFDVEVIPDVGHGLLGPVDEDGNDHILLSTPDSYLSSMVRWLQAR